MSQGRAPCFDTSQENGMGQIFFDNRLWGCFGLLQFHEHDDVHLVDDDHNQPTLPRWRSLPVPKPFAAKDFMYTDRGMVWGGGDDGGRESDVDRAVGEGASRYN